MKKLIKTGILISLLFASVITAQAQFSDLNSMPGSFSRMGFGARGMAMGNAMSAVITGDLVSYYNPAISVFQVGNSFNASMTLLSLDRSLNFINFTKRFGEPQDIPGAKFSPSAGISLGFISSGVSRIDGRDDEGISTGDLSTSEMQYFCAVSGQFSKKLAIGISFKLYYNKIYEGLTTTSLGCDLGLLYIINDDLTVSIVIVDLLSKYKWDTSTFYGSDGQVTEDQFPLTKKIGIAYKLLDSKLIAAGEFETSNGGVNFLRFGAEYNIVNNLYLRCGIDRIALNNHDIPARPSAGLTFNYKMKSTTIGFNYAYVVEPYSAWNAHVIGIDINF